MYAATLQEYKFIDIVVAVATSLSCGHGFNRFSVNNIFMTLLILFVSLFDSRLTKLFLFTLYLLTFYFISFSEERVFFGLNCGFIFFISCLSSLFLVFCSLQRSYILIQTKMMLMLKGNSKKFSVLMR